MAVWMVERESGGISMDALAAAQGAAIAAAGKSTAQGTPVRYLRSVFSRGTGAAAVVRGCQRCGGGRGHSTAGLPYNRIAEALDLPAPG